MRELPFLIDGDALRGKKFMPVDRLTNASSAQAVESLELDEGGKDMDGMVAVSDWDEEIEDISFILFISFQPLLLLVPVSKPLVVVSLPVFIGLFKVSGVHLMLCQSLSSLAEHFQLLPIVVTDLFVLLSNTGQALSDMEEFLPPRGTMAFESSAHGPRGELQLTEFIGGCHNLLGNCERVLPVDHWGVDLWVDWEGFGNIHVDCEA